MAADPPKPDPRVIGAYLDDVDLELDAAKHLVADPPNRFAAFHLEQAAEKLVKARRLGRGLRVTADHNIEALVDEHPVDDPRRTKLRILARCARTRYLSRATDAHARTTTRSRGRLATKSS